MKNFYKIFSVLLFLPLVFCNDAFALQLGRRAKHGMVVSANDIATKVGVEVLKKGGNAIDAAVAVGFTLAVTFPSAGNIGGGGFLVYYRNDGFNTTIDYREKAPSSAYKDMYLDSLGQPIPFKSTKDVTSAGVPGSVAGLLFALEKYGTMSLKDLIQPAIDLAENGFKLSYELAQSFNSNYDEFVNYPSSKKIFTKNDEKWSEGDLFVQKDLAKTLKLIQQKGRNGFYEGETAQLIVNQVKANGGFISIEDLKNYRPVERPPTKGTYRGYEIISMGPPSSGGIALIQALNILENKKFEKNDFHSSEHLHYLIETLKHVFSDRAEYLGDSDFVKIPVNRLISKEYAKEIFNSIKNDKAISAKEINPRMFQFRESIETTHYSIYDSYGNAVSVTTTINSSYGSSVVVDGAGFLLNNEMDDFSIKPGYPNQFDLIGNNANSIEPNKRMLSSMTPTIVLCECIPSGKDKRPFLIVGSPGGSMIITSVLQVLMNVIDFGPMGMDIKTAIDLPRIHHQWLPEEVFYESFSIAKDVMEKLELFGHKFTPRNSMGRVEGILIDEKNGIIFGASDSRGYGLAEGF